MVNFLGQGGMCQPSSAQPSRGLDSVDGGGLHHLPANRGHRVRRRPLRHQVQIRNALPHTLLRTGNFPTLSKIILYLHLISITFDQKYIFKSFTS